jgi:hypothetical protein
VSDSAARASRYRNKAEEVLAIASAMKDALARKVLMGVADDYIALAEMVERSHAVEAIAENELADVQKIA